MSLKGAGFRYLIGRKKSMKQLEAEDRTVQQRLKRADLKQKIKSEKSQLFKKEHPFISRTGDILGASLSHGGTSLAKGMWGKKARPIRKKKHKKKRRSIRRRVTYYY